VNAIRNWTYKGIVVSCLLFTVVAGVAAWIISGMNNPGLTGRNTPTAISAGDTVVISIVADDMNDVYGYEFDLHFDKALIEYSGRLHSEIDDIVTIFAKDKEWYVLVGATMIGEQEGYNGHGVPVCQVEFTALTDFELNVDSSSDHIALSRVNTVTSDLQYVENVDGWTTRVSTT